MKDRKKPVVVEAFRMGMEQIQIESTDGKKYLTSSYNCIMIKEESGNAE